MSDLGAALIYLGIVGVLVVGSIWLGMLIAPRLGRLTEPKDEGPGDDD